MSPLEKVPARQNVMDALNGHDYSGKTRVVRVNGVTTQWCLGDLMAVVGGAGRNLDCVMIPKVEDAGQLHFVDHVLAQLETEHGIEHRIGIEAQIENGRGAMNIREIAQASPRLETLIFGPGDYAASMGVGSLVIGSIDPGYPGDQWHYILSLIVTAARALRAAGDRRPVHRHQEHRRVPRGCACARGGRLRRQVGAAPRPGRHRQRGVRAQPGGVRRRPPAARGVRARHPGGAEGGRHARGPDDRRGVAQDRRGGRRTGRRGRHERAERRRHDASRWRADRRSSARWSSLVRQFTDEQIIPVASDARARRHVPRRDRGRAQGAGPVRLHDPGAVRRPRAST